MKKFTLVAAAAALALGATAGDYNVNPSYSNVEAKGNTFYVLVASDEGVAALESAGGKVVDLRPDDVDRFLYVWENTFTGGDGAGMGVDDALGFTSLTVANVGWSGAGYCMVAPADLSGLTDEYKFHAAYMTESTAPASVAFGLFDNMAVAVGTAFDDNGKITPSAGDKATDDWQGIEISLADIKKLNSSWPGLPSGLNAFEGNVVSLLAGGVEGTNISLDAIYLYGPTNSGVNDIIASEEGVTEYFNLQGVRVANPTSGLYIAKTGTKVEKVLVK